MALDVAAARAAVSQAALARDEDALRAIADSLPPLVAYAYERHRARAFANAIRGARDSAVAELCLGVAACAPTAATFVADSAQLRLLAGEPEQEPSTQSARPSPKRLPRLALSGAAVAAAVAALAFVPGRAFEGARPEAAGVTAPARTAVPRVVVTDRPAAPTSPASRTRGATTDAEAAPLLVASPLAARAEAPAVSSQPPAPPPPAAAASRRPLRPTAAAPIPSAEPAPPPAATPTPAPAPASPPTVTVAPIPVAAPVAATTTRSRGKAQAADRLKKRSAPTPAGTETAPPAQPPPASQEPAEEALPPAGPRASEDAPGHAYGHEKDKNGPKQ
jgi:hypothetical protein